MAWTNVPKPTESSITSSGFTDGEPFGLLIALTQSTQTTVTSVITGWSNINKPTVASWVSVAKPTTQNWTNVAKPTT